MNLTFVRKLALLILVFALLASSRAYAQAPLEPAQLPTRTTFYLIWRGTPPAEARKTNSLLALWDDPDLAPLRAAIFQNMQGNSPKDSSAQPLNREEADLHVATSPKDLVRAVNFSGETNSTTRIFGVGNSTLNSSICVSKPQARNCAAMNSAFSLP